jgi:hypothetical protein
MVAEIVADRSPVTAFRASDLDLKSTSPRTAMQIFVRADRTYTLDVEVIEPLTAF